jgi:hypothetical protein
LNASDQRGLQSWCLNNAGCSKPSFFFQKNVYNSEYPNSPIPNDVFKPKDYYSFIKDKWGDISIGAYYIDHKGAKIKYDKPNMLFDIECHDGMTKTKYEDMSEIVIKDMKK